MNYLLVLNERYEEIKEIKEEQELDRYEFLAEYIFGFTTYDSEKSELFGRKALEFCQVIANRTNFEYIEESDENYTWYLIMANSELFSRYLNWGTSIRGAWWDFHRYQGMNFYIPLEIGDLEPSLHFDGDNGNSSNLSQEQWINFINAMTTFVSQ